MDLRVNINSLEFSDRLILVKLYNIEFTLDTFSLFGREVNELLVFIFDRFLGVNQIIYFSPDFTGLIFSNHHLKNSGEFNCKYLY